MIENYPKTFRALQKWYVDKMLERLPENMKTSDIIDSTNKYMEVAEKVIPIMIDENPRVIFDMLDIEGIVVATSFVKNKFKCTVKIANGAAEGRIEAERKALIESFDQLESMLLLNEDD